MITIIGATDSMSSFSDFFDSLPSVALWVIGILVALAIISIFFRSAHSILYRLLQAGLVLLLLCGILGGAYFVFFDRCETLATYEDGKSVRLIGVCREVKVSPEGDGRRASFLLRDPTGTSRVVTTSGAPREGSFLYLRGRKGTFDGDNTFVESDYQLSPF